MMSVLLRCKSIAEHLNQSHVVLTLDEALYWRAKELVWANSDLNNFVIRLGGFHIAKNFLAVIGKHMEKSGLSDLWTESGMYGERTANNILSGKSWNRGVRAHKLSLEALWRIFLRSFETWQVENNKTAFTHVASLASKFNIPTSGNNQDKETGKEALHEILKCMGSFSSDIEEFVSAQSNPTFHFWKQYMDMVHLLLLFIRAEREGNW